MPAKRGAARARRRRAPSGPLTPAAYARHRKVSKQAVARAIREGRIPTIGARKLVDPAIADVAWNQNTDPSKPKGPKPGATNGSAPAPGTQAAETLKLTGIKAQMAQLEYERRAGRLVDGAAAEARYFDLIRKARDKILGSADRLGPALAPITDARACTLRLRQELTKLVASIADMPGENGAGPGH